jgi:hypothetical protein
MPLRTYGTFISAENSLRAMRQFYDATSPAPECRIWGFDPLNARNSGTKRFCAGSRNEYLRFILDEGQPDPHFYEVITAGSSARFMIDADMSFNISDSIFAQSECILGKKFVDVVRRAWQQSGGVLCNNRLIRDSELTQIHEKGMIFMDRARSVVLQAVREHVCHLLSRDNESVQICALDASSLESGKFSLHIHFPSLVLQSHCVDGALLGHALNASINMWVYQLSQEQEKNWQLRSDEDTLLAVALMWPWHNPPNTCTKLGRVGLVDTSVYSRFRLMRMMFQTKRGRGRPLRPVCVESGKILMAPCGISERLKIFQECYEIIPSRDELLRSGRETENSTGLAVPAGDFREVCGAGVDVLELGLDFIGKECLFLGSACERAMELRKQRRKEGNSCSSEDGSRVTLQEPKFWHMRQIFCNTSIDVKMPITATEQFVSRFHGKKRQRTCKSLLGGVRHAPSPVHAPESEAARLTAGIEFDGRVCSTGRRKRRWALLYTTSVVYNERGEQKTMREVSLSNAEYNKYAVEGMGQCWGEDVRLHCPMCDTMDGKESVGEYSPDKTYTRPDGNPSARSFMTEKGDTAVYCFSCQLCYRIHDMQETTGFAEEAESIVFDAESMKYFPAERLLEESLPYIRRWSFLNKTLRREGISLVKEIGEDAQKPVELAPSASFGLRVHSLRHCRVFGGIEGGVDNCSVSAHQMQPKNHSDTPEDLQTDCWPHFIAVNAGMGSGKTEAAASFSHNHEVSSTVVVCYRRALTRELSSRFDVPYYLDFKSECDWINAESVAVCVNSLTKLRNFRNPLVVIDEAGFVRRAFVSGTFRSTEHRSACLFALGKLLRMAAVVLLLQHGLSETDVDFFMDVTRSFGGGSITATRGVSSTGQISPSQGLSVKKFIFQVPPPLDGRGYFLTTQLRLWLVALRQAIKNGRKKTFIPCSQRKTAEAVALFVLSHCRPDEYSSTEWSERVALVTGDKNGLLPSGHFATAEDFVSTYWMYEVAIVTCALETGVSLMNHYTTVFGMYRTFPLAHAAQVQLANRVRNAKCSIIYAERGRYGALDTDVKHVSRLFNVMSTCTEDAIIASTLAEVTTEAADTFNNNDLIWMHRQNAKSLSLSAEIYGKDEVISKESNGNDWNESYGTSVAEENQQLKLHQQSPSELQTSGGRTLPSPAFEWLLPMPVEELEEQLKEVGALFWEIAKRRDKGIKRYLVCPDNDNALAKLMEQLEEGSEVLTHLSIAGALHARPKLRDVLTPLVFEAVSMLERTSTFTHAALAVTSQSEIDAIDQEQRLREKYNESSSGQRNEMRELESAACNCIGPCEGHQERVMSRGSCVGSCTDMCRAGIRQAAVSGRDLESTSGVNSSRWGGIMSERCWPGLQDADRVSRTRMYFMYIDHVAQRLCRGDLNGSHGGEESSWARLVRAVPAMRGMTLSVMRVRENLARVELGLLLCEMALGCVLPPTQSQQQEEGKRASILFFPCPETKLESIRRVLLKNYSSAKGFADLNLSRHVRAICRKISLRKIASELRKWTPLRVRVHRRRRRKQRLIRTKLQHEQIQEQQIVGVKLAEEGKDDEWAEDQTECGFKLDPLPGTTAMVLCANSELSVCQLESDCSWVIFRSEVDAIKESLRILHDIRGVTEQKASAAASYPVDLQERELHALQSSGLKDATGALMEKIEALGMYLHAENPAPFISG